ncbi:MAG: hypothetical protein ACR2PY_07995 [Salinispira sp.]
MIFVLAPMFAQTNDHSICVKSRPKGGDILSVGTVQISILEEDAFQSLNGPEWVLMDGRVLKERTELTPHIVHLKNEEGKTTIPNAGGRFLRMTDNGAGIDPDGERKLGSSQEDELVAHSHEIPNTINHNRNRRSTGSGTHIFLPGTRASGETGGLETRPTNVAVNYFVKICECRTENCK